MNETEFVAALRKLPLHAGARGLEDDCAILQIGNETLVITHDMMTEDTHFRPHADMADVAWKLLASNLSDLAAKGTALPAPPSWPDDFCATR
jgi:thiamine-monophosphate kinase